METWILAHQGGWDEALLVLVPVALFALLLRLAHRRAKAVAAEREAAADSDPTTTDEVER